MEVMDLIAPDNVFRNFYRGKRVLVTGHTGFKGSWLSLWLLKLGAVVGGVSAYLPSDPCNFVALGLKKLVKHYDGDIRNFHQILEVVDDFKPHIIFHLAAQSIVRRSYDEPKLTFDTNLGGTVNILECIKQRDYIEVAVIITSDKCYKNMEWTWGYRENDQLGGDDPYSASKACAEIAAHSYCLSYFSKKKQVNVATTRAGNVIGGGDWAEDRLIPDYIRAWADGKEVFIRNPQATRPWQHVLEPLSGYLWLGALLGDENIGKHLSGEAFNFGPRSDVVQPVSEVVQALNTLLKTPQRNHYVADDHSKPESNLLKLCCDKALTMLHWKALLPFEKSIEYTAFWYNKYYENSENMLEFSKHQIEEYSLMAMNNGLKWASIEKK